MGSNETTQLPPQREAEFQAWLRKNNVRDLDHPDSHYDYRGAFLAGVGRSGNAHFPDTFKQHGHPTFSVESQYSKGPADGGHWNGETFIPAKQVNPMGDVYQNIDFERMLSDLGQALERNKAGSPDTPAPVYPKPEAPAGVPTARFDDVPQGAAAAPAPAPAPGAQQMAPMTVHGGASPPMSPQDMQTMAELQQLAPQAYGMGYGTAGAGSAPMPHPAHAPPPAVAQQLAGINPNPAAGGPPAVYPQLTPPPDFNGDPNAAGGLAAYAAMR